MQETQETQAESLGQKDPVEEEMATHSSILAWKSHGHRSLAGYSLRGHKRARHNLVTKEQQILKDFISLYHYFMTIYR